MPDKIHIFAVYFGNNLENFFAHGHVPGTDLLGEPFVGGTEAFLARFAMGLKRQGVEVVCYTCKGSVIGGVEIRTCGVPGGALAYPRAPHELKGDEILTIRAYEDAVMYQAIEDARTDSSIDVLHNHSFQPSPYS